MGDVVLHETPVILMPDLIFDSGGSVSMLNEVIVNKMIEQVGRVCKSLGDECWLDPRNGSKCV